MEAEDEDFRYSRRRTFTSLIYGKYLQCWEVEREFPDTSMHRKMIQNNLSHLLLFVVTKLFFPMEPETVRKKTEKYHTSSIVDCKYNP